MQLSIQSKIKELYFLLALTKSYSFFSFFSGLPLFFFSAVPTYVLLLLCYREIKIDIGTVFLIVGTIFTPLFTSLMFGSVDIRLLLLKVEYVLIFMLGAFAFSRNADCLQFRWFVVAAIISFAAGIVSMVNPLLFLNLAEMVDAKSQYFGRAFGFFLQPNALGIALALNFVACALIIRIWRPVFFVFTLIAVAVTGSRSALLLFFASSFLVWIALRGFQMRLIIGVSVAGLIVLFVPPLLLDRFDDSEVVNRLLFLSQAVADIGTTSEEFQSGSVADRMYYQNEYLSVINERPLVGYGIGSLERLESAGLITNSAHNTQLEILLEGGLISLAAKYGSLVALMYFARFSKYFVLFIFSVELVGLVSTTVYAERYMWLLLGILYGKEKQVGNFYTVPRLRWC